MFLTVFKPDKSTSLLKVTFFIYLSYQERQTVRREVDKQEHNVNKTLKYNFMTMFV